MKTMNRIVSAFLLTLAASLPVMSQTVTVFQKNGETVKYNVKDVEKIVFEEEVPFDETNLLNEVYVPCEGFRDWIDNNLGDGSGYYSLEQAAAYDGEIDLSRVAEVTDITGIEYFKNLTSLIAEDGYFGDFKIGALTHLTNLRLVNTSVTQLDFTGLTELEKATISRNKITSLNLAANPKLKALYCDCNQLTELDLTGCTGLETLICAENQLTSLVLPECPLVTFSAHSNNIGSIDLSKVIKTLDLVNVNRCGLTTLNLDGASKLTWLECSENPFTSAPIITGCTKLESLRIENISTEMGEMDFSECPSLNMLRLDYSKIGGKIDLTKCKKMYELSLQGCGLTEINLSGLINLGYVNVSDNGFRRLDISTADGIYSLYSNRITSEGAQIKVWADFDIENAYNYGFYTDETVELVHEFTN